MPEILEMNKYLSEKNAHARDSRIQFQDDGHVYIVDGDRTFTSVTTIVSTLYEHFDQEKIIKKMRLSNKSFAVGQKYHGMSDEDIRKQWADNCKLACDLGTMMHFNIESFYNKNPFTNPDMPEIGRLFVKYQKEHADARGLVPYRTEMFVFDTDLKIAGSIDMLYQDPDDPDILYIYDWKRVKELKRENRFQSMYPPFQHLADCNYWHYSIQLNIYRYILEKEYKKKIGGMCLVVLHEDNDDYIVAEVPRMENEIENLMQQRLRDLATK